MGTVVNTGTAEVTQPPAPPASAAPPARRRFRAPGETNAAGYLFLAPALLLIGVFFFSHQRLWIVVEDGNVYMGGDANRNRLGFEDRAKRLAELIRQPQSAG